MNIGILTWYKAINHGAVLQAYASCQMLKELGVTPVMLDFDWVLDDEVNKKNKIIRRIKHFSLGKLIWYYNVKKLYSQKKQNFIKFREEYIPLGKKYEEEFMDAVYIGSDMVFDLSQGYNPYMYGVNVKSPYVFSYAASFGYTKDYELKENEHYKEIINALNALKEIGYRDQNTYRLCKDNDVNTKMQETIDPVLAYGFQSELSEWDSKKWCDEKYMLIYAYDSTMNDKQTVNEIIKFAHKRKLKIVCCGYYHKWCDECIPASPKEFIEMFKHAQYVITDTFHGTVFSLIMNKRFVSIIRKNGFKVKYLLEQTKLDNQIFNDTNKIEELLENEIDYSYYEKWIQEERQMSKDFIKRNVEKARKCIL